MKILTFISFALILCIQNVKASTYCVDVYNPEALWEIHRWTQEEVDTHIPTLQHKVGTIWWQKLKPTPDYTLDETNTITVSAYVWSTGRTITLGWTDDLTQGFTYIQSDVRFDADQAHVEWRIDINHPIAQRMLAAQQGFATVGSRYDYLYEWTTHEGVTLECKDIWN